MNRTRSAAMSALAAAVLLGGCTGVPTSSAPEVVTTVNAGEPSGSSAPAPTKGADARTVLREFLTASANADTITAVKANFLTHDAASRWTPTSTIVVDAIQVGNLEGNLISVTGRKVGAVDNNTGIYKPGLAGDGSGGESQPYGFTMRNVPGQGWRIDGVQQNVVIVDAEGFQRAYQQHPLYFFDPAGQRLVADLRYTSHSDPALLGNWLVAQLAAGPRPDLQGATTIEMPNQAQQDPSKVTIALGSPAQVQVPGASGLDPATRTALAATLAYTLLPVVTGDVQVIDAGRPTLVLGTRTSFTASDFSDAVQPANQSPPVYYIVDGHVVNVNGTPLAPVLSHYALQSVAVAHTGDSPDLRVAGTINSGAGRQRLVVGTVASGLSETSLRGGLSRPAWAPNLDEVWIGSGPNLYRVGLHAHAVEVPLSTENATLSGRIRAVRFSPEGTRIALVLDSGGGNSELWVGTVTRGQGQNAQVRVDNLTQISPQGVAITDVAWNDQINLFAIGREVSSGVASVYEVHVDGSLWTSRGTSNLPDAPDSITVAENEVPWVSAGGTVWAQQGGSWISPGASPTHGVNPVYLE